VAGTGETLVDAAPVEQVETGGGGDRLGRLGRDDAEFGLRPGQRDLDIEPSLPAVFDAVEGADAGIGYARGGRQFVAHSSLSSDAHWTSGWRRFSQGRKTRQPLHSSITLSAVGFERYS
jgi:hypothetical protein